MPYSIVNLNVTVQTDHLKQARETLEAALDELVRSKIPVYDTCVEEKCSDPPIDLTDFEND